MGFFMIRVDCPYILRGVNPDHETGMPQDQIIVLIIREPCLRAMLRDLMERRSVRAQRGSLAGVSGGDGSAVGAEAELDREGYAAHADADAQHLRR
jgi:hypothetical protein